LMPVSTLALRTLDFSIFGQVFVRIRCQAQKAALRGNHRLGDSRALGQEDFNFFFQFAAPRPDNEWGCS
jgi:hypothetical protein